MFFRPRPQRRSSALWLFPALLLLCLPSWAAEKLHFHADDYEIDAVLNPHEHKIAAHAKVKITALDDLNIASFHLHNLLRLTKVSDAAGKQDSEHLTPFPRSERRTVLCFLMNGS